MMKKITKVLGCLFLFGIIVAGGVWWYSRTSNPWNAKCVGDISAPIGYSRVEVPKGSYAEWLRKLPLKKKGSNVKLYTGGDANFLWLSTGVIDLPMLSYAEQCADMTMRI